MSAQEVPQGTMGEVLDWVDEDPQRAQQALDAERAGPNRSTLISQLETIVSQTSTPGSDPQPGTEPQTEPGVTRPEEQTPEGQPTSPDDPTPAERDTEGELDEETGLAPAPEPPTETTIYAEDAGTVIHTLAVRDPDVEVPEDAMIAADPEYDRTPEAVAARGRVSLDDADVEPIDGEQVEYLSGASGTYGMILSLNGTSYALDKQMVGSLKQMVDKTVVGLAL